ncbi:hypothetical protein [Bacillus sp. FJAT-27445]|uniref:hypothetical protein n=1 Tax=Bacillus sp. FJAT-27445 TaxID=1679166 RepID=UPI000743CF75|nr:hypothetical protein [Bacillus sp. FJAT-27445]
MDWLRVVFSLASIIILLGLMMQTFNFKKEVKEAINDDRSLSDNFVDKWDKKLSKVAFLSIIATVFGIIAIVLR